MLVAAGTTLLGCSALALPGRAILGRRATRATSTATKSLIMAASGGADVTTQGFGSWSSPITSSFITSAGVGLGGLSLAPESGSLLWMERRPQEKGRSVLCRRDPDDKTASERGAVDVTPQESNVRTVRREGAAHAGADAGHPPIRPTNNQPSTHCTLDPARARVRRQGLGRGRG